MEVRALPSELMATVQYELAYLTNDCYDGKTIAQLREKLGEYSAWWGMVRNKDRYIAYVGPDLVGEDYVVRPDDQIVFLVSYESYVY